MTKTLNSSYCFLHLFNKLLSDLKTGKKRLPNGRRYQQSSIDVYQQVLKNLQTFSLKQKFKLRVHNVDKLTERQCRAEHNYWKKFYLRFSDFLYNHLNHFDNYVGTHMKIIRAFFTYLNKDLLLNTGEFYRLLYVPKEQTPVIALTPAQLKFLINNTAFEKSLPPRLQKAKDIFVIGCTTALRFSDLMLLQKQNITQFNGNYYLQVRAKKTGIKTSIKLSAKALNIFLKYSVAGDCILPRLSNTNFNLYIKEIAELAGWTQSIKKWREKRGVEYELKKGKRSYRYCDLLSSHTMRKTAISTFIALGMPEHLVRNISGHSPGSKDFYRYVSFSQTDLDRELKKFHAALKKCKPKPVTPLQKKVNTFIFGK